MLRLLRLIFLTKKIFLKPQKKEILIIDKLTGKRLCLIFNKKKISFLETRLSEINVQIFLLAIVKKISNSSLRLSQHYILSYIKYVDPNLIVTSNDVIAFYWQIKKYFPQKKIIIFQNNYRNGWDFGNIFLGSKKEKRGLCDLFVTYCDAIKPLYSKKIKSNFLSIGSLENNFFKKNFNNKKKYIVFISQFKNWSNKNFAISNQNKKIFLKDSYLKSDKIILNFLNEFCKKNNKKLKIFLRNSIGELASEEESYYEENLDFKVDFLKKKNRFDGYGKISNYDFFVTNDSTLGYECLARNKRVAFFNNRYSVSKFKNGHKHHYGWPKKLPESGAIWTNSIQINKMEKVLNFITKANSTQWSQVKKKYIDDVIEYNYKNKKLLKLIDEMLK